MCSSLNRAGSKRSSNIGRPFRLSMPLAPALPAATSRNASGSSPASFAVRTASARTAAFTAPIVLVSSFAICPWPSGPTCTIRWPITSNSGSARSNAARSPPAKIVSVPSSAFGFEPETGASTKSRGARRSPTAREAVGEIVDMSTTSAPSGSAAAAPWSPNSTSSTSGASGTIVMKASAPAAASAGVAAAVAPCSAAKRSAFSRVRVWTESSKPASRRLRAIGAPMMPSPTNPTRLIRAMATTSRSLDSQPVARSERARRLGGELPAVQQVPTRLARLSVLRPRWRVPAALRDQRVAHLGERLELPHNAVAAPPGALSARAAPQRVLDRPQRKLDLERLNRRVERVRHRHVHAAGPVGVGTGALATAEGLVVGEVVVAERQVVHRALAERLAEGGQHEVGHARGGLNVPGGHGGGRAGVEQRALRRDHGERPVGPLAGRHVWIAQHAQREVTGRQRDRERTVQVAVVLRGRAGEVELHPLAVHTRTPSSSSAMHPRVRRSA